MTINEIYKKFTESSGATTDTRDVKKDNFFFALKGENFNGNKFAKQAIEKGAYCAIIDEEEYCINSDYILVENVLNTLQELSAYHRSQFKIPIIAITGTNGKTTTKELIHAVLKTKFNVTATKGNYNNHIGVPLSLLRIKKETEIAIIEMGANHIGEIASYCKWVKPTLGLITNIGKAHLEGFGSYENIIIAKTELYKELKENNKIIFYNKADDLLRKIVKDYTYKISYGPTKDVDTQVEISNNFPTVEVLFEKEQIKTNLFGEYNLSNISVAIALASYFDIPNNYIKLALESYKPKNNRSEIKQISDNIIILDAYNANPTSVKAAVESFSKLNVKNKILILGDMFELGKDSIKLHEEIVSFAEQQHSFDEIILVGTHFSKCSNIAKSKVIESTKEALVWYKNQKFSLATILIKGSRGMQLEKLLS